MSNGFSAEGRMSQKPKPKRSDSYKSRYGMEGGNIAVPEPKLHYTRKAKARRALGRIHAELYNPKHRERAKRVGRATYKVARGTGKVTVHIVKHTGRGGQMIVQDLTGKRALRISKGVDFVMYGGKRYRVVRKGRHLK